MTKVNLSVSEMELVTNASFILTKNEIIRKVYALFGTLSQSYINRLNTINISDEIRQSTPKIFKGENYQELPWVMLDYPRIFDKDNICAIRTFFWWGNYCSISLILKGKYLDKIKPYSADLKEWKIGEDEQSLWQHDIDSLNFRQADELDINKQALSFLKLAKKIPLTEWNHIESFMLNNFSSLSELLKD